MPELQVAAALMRSHNAIVRRVRLLISRAMRANSSGCSAETAAAASAAAAAVAAAQADAKGSSLEAGLPAAGLRAELQSVPVPQPASGKAVVASVAPKAVQPLPQLQSAGVPPGLPPGWHKRPSDSSVPAGKAAGGCPVDETAAVQAILRARAAAAQARNSISLPAHLLTPLLQCIQSGNSSSTATSSSSIGAESVEPRGPAAVCMGDGVAVSQAQEHMQG